MRPPAAGWRTLNVCRCWELSPADRKPEGARVERGRRLIKKKHRVRLYGRPTPAQTASACPSLVPKPDALPACVGRPLTGLAELGQPCLRPSTRLGHRGRVIWTAERIREEWLQDSAVALPLSQLAHLFDLVETTYGVDWLEALREPKDTTGSLVTLQVANYGQLIKAVNGLPGSRELLQRLGAKEAGAKEEALTVAMLRSDETLTLSLSPATEIGARERKPDVLVCRGEDCVYVEVSAPQRSLEYQAIRARIQAIADRALTLTPYGSSSEIMIHTEPAEAEIDDALAMLGTLCSPGTLQYRQTPNVGIVANSCAPGDIVPFDHGTEYHPAVGTARVQGKGDKRKHAIVRHVFTDERAAEFLSRKSKQLPKDAPGVIVLHVSGATGAIAAWRILLQNRFRPDRYSRVSAIVLVDSGSYGTPDGEAWLHSAQVVLNAYAAKALPDWVPELLGIWTGAEPQPIT